MSTKQLYEKTSEGMKEVSPLVSIEDIYSKLSDTPLEALVALFNHVKCEWNGSVADTRRTVPLFLRRSGLFITYNNNGAKYVTEFFSAGADQITTEGWVKDSNWTSVPDEDYISAGVKPGVGTIGYEQLNDNLKQLFREKVNVTNFPDDEDIASVDNMLKLKDREVDAAKFQSKGYVILRKNLRLVNGVVKNILTQNMINQPNTIYEVRYDFDLNGKILEMPENCTLKFEGGSFRNGTIKFNNTLLIGDIKLNCNFIGTIKNDYITAHQLCAKGDGITDDTNVFNRFENYIYSTYKENNNNHIGSVFKLILEPGIYLVDNIELQSGEQIIGTSIYNTIIKAKNKVTKGVINILHPKSVISNVTIDGGSDEGFNNIGLYAYGNNGQYSVAENIKFINCTNHSAVIEDTNMFTFYGCHFNSGENGYLLLDGADCCTVNRCNFETNKDFYSPYAIKVQTKITNNTTANNTIIKECWFESNFENTFETSIEIDAFNVSILNNHFHTPSNSRKKYVINVLNKSDNILIAGNNIQNLGTIDNIRELVLNVEESVRTVFAFNNRGLYSNNNCNIRNMYTTILLMDGSILSNNKIFTNDKELNIITSSNKNNNYLSPIHINDCYLWQDMNNVFRISNIKPESNYDGLPIGSFVKFGDSTQFPQLTRFQKGFVYASYSSPLYFWDGDNWLRGSDGYPKDTKLQGNKDTKPTNIRSGYKYYNETSKMLEVYDGNNWKTTDGYTLPIIGYTANRPTNAIIGQPFFDRSLNKPIWWTGTKWVNATGEDV